MPTAGSQAPKGSCLSSHWIDMKWLWVKLAGKINHLVLIHVVFATDKRLPDVQVIQVERSLIIHFSIQSPLLPPSPREASL